MNAEASTRITNFLKGLGRDSRGRTLSDVLEFSDHELEVHHDYIQWLFPLDQPSLAVPGSPVLSPADIAAIQASEDCRENLRRAAERMLRFYSDNDHWLVASDHNHKRITRIIKSLRLLVGQQEAESFYRAIMARVTSSNAPVAAVNQQYWRETVGLPAAAEST